MTQREPRDQAVCDLYEAIVMPESLTLNKVNAIVGNIIAAAQAETLRDKFAMAALPIAQAHFWSGAAKLGLETEHFQKAGTSVADVLAGAAYEIADAMLKEREKGGE